MKIPRGYDSCVDAYRHSISDTNFKRSSKKIPRTLTSVLTQSSAFRFDSDPSLQIRGHRSFEVIKFVSNVKHIYARAVFQHQ